MNSLPAFQLRPECITLLIKKHHCLTFFKTYHCRREVSCEGSSLWPPQPWWCTGNLTCQTQWCPLYWADLLFQTLLNWVVYTYRGPQTGWGLQCQVKYRWDSKSETTIKSQLFCGCPNLLTSLVKWRWKEQPAGPVWWCRCGGTGCPGPAAPADWLGVCKGAAHYWGLLFPSRWPAQSPDKCHRTGTAGQLFLSSSGNTQKGTIQF